MTNRLINEKSPYLLQHAENQMNWRQIAENPAQLSALLQQAP